MFSHLTNTGNAWDNLRPPTDNRCKEPTGHVASRESVRKEVRGHKQNPPPLRWDDCPRVMKGAPFLACPQKKTIHLMAAKDICRMDLHAQTVLTKAWTNNGQGWPV